MVKLSTLAFVLARVVVRTPNVFMISFWLGSSDTTVLYLIGTGVVAEASYFLLIPRFLDVDEGAVFLDFGAIIVYESEKTTREECSALLPNDVKSADVLTAACH